MYVSESVTCSDDPNPELCVVADSRHLAPFMHGDDSHSSVSVSQLKPVNPDAQVHAYSAAGIGVELIDEVESVHTPVFMQGNEEHSSVSTAQLTPVYPITQSHEYASSVAEHDAPFVHGEDAHSSMSVSQS
jgi:hypothetical protein